MAVTGEGAYPGRSLGLPERGSGAVAGYSRRFLAVVVDFAVLVVPYAMTPERWRGWVGLVLWFVNLGVLPSWQGVTAGHFTAGVRVVAVDETGRALPEQRGLTILTAVGRSMLWLCPPAGFVLAMLTINRDKRTLFDRLTRTVIVKR